MTLINFVLLILRSPKTWLDKCLKSPASEAPSKSSMVNRPKNCWNLHHSTFIIFIDHCKGNWFRESFSYWYVKTWGCFLTHWLLLASILVFIGTINDTNCLISDQQIWWICCDADFKSIMARWLCCLSLGPLKQDFLDIYLTTFSESIVSDIQNLWGSSLFSKSLKFILDFKMQQKRGKNIFLSEIIASELVSLVVPIKARILAKSSQCVKKQPQDLTYQ